ncbi:MAG: hypothetical protein WAK02_11005, partial [Terriglobales bacterium]
VHAKSNIGEIGKSIGYEISTGLFRWTGETSITANDLASAGGMAEEDRDAVTEATEILADILRAGPKLVNDVQTELRAAGVADRTGRRAKLRLGVKGRKRGGADGRWEWFLDE